MVSMKHDISFEFLEEKDLMSKCCNSEFNCELTDCWGSQHETTTLIQHSDKVNSGHDQTLVTGCYVLELSSSNSFYVNSHYFTFHVISYFKYTGKHGKSSMIKKYFWMLYLVYILPQKDRCMVWQPHTNGKGVTPPGKIQWAKTHGTVL
jgi:hypothetical protein